MIFQVARIITDVRVCLDNNEVDTALLAPTENDQDTLMLDELIRSKIVEGVRRVHEVAPYYLLEQGHNFADTGSATYNNIYWDERLDGAGWILLPHDFHRLVVFEMSDWERPATTPIGADSVEYKKQRSRIKGIRGTSQKPIVAIVQRPEGLALEFYSCKNDDATVTKAVYLPYPKIDDDGGVDISERCYEAVIYTIAGLTLISCGEADKGGVMMNIAGTLLNPGGEQ